MASQAIGSAGELIVQARLLVRGWTVGNVNTGGMMNAPAVDLLAAKGSQNIRIAVKATGHGSQNVQWSVDQNWTTLFRGDVRPDFVVFVWFIDAKQLDACRIFVVPAKVVDADVRDCHLHWHKYPRRDGSPRKNSRHAAVSWTHRYRNEYITRICLQVEGVRKRVGLTRPKGELTAHAASSGQQCTTTR
jgi:hypothetical protein